jgi:hypothetical protein
MRSKTNRSPIVAMTAWAASHAVVTAPITAIRPCHSSVRPPSVPTVRTQRPSYISRSAAITSARSSRPIDRIDVTSLMTSTPCWPI